MPFSLLAPAPPARPQITFFSSFRSLPLVNGCEGFPDSSIRSRSSHSTGRSLVCLMGYSSWRRRSQIEKAEDQSGARCFSFYFLGIVRRCQGMNIREQGYRMSGLDVFSTCSEVLVVHQDGLFHLEEKKDVAYLASSQQGLSKTYTGDGSPGSFRSRTARHRSFRRLMMVDCHNVRERLRRCLATGTQAREHVCRVPALFPKS
nr:hypothetical protein CFP56_74981 [Quercus suber]